MKDEEIKNGINELRKITMTPEEKNRIFENVLNHKNFIKKPEKSPWFSSFEFFIQRNRVWSYGTMALLFVVLGSGGLVSASQKSLPGNNLYSLKVNLVEPAGSLLRYIPTEKAKYESNLATKRLIEAETLARTNELDIVKEKQINDLLTKHTIALDKAITKAEENEPEEEIYKIALDFQNEMNTHAQKLDQVKNKTINKKRIEKNIKKEIPIEKETEKDFKKDPLFQKPPQIKSETSTGLATNLDSGIMASSNLKIENNLEIEPLETGSMMAPSATSNATLNIIEDKINKEPTEVVAEISEETTEKIENQQEYQNITEDESIYLYEYEENSISQNARANAQRIKDILERKYYRK